MERCTAYKNHKITEISEDLDIDSLVAEIKPHQMAFHDAICCGVQDNRDLAKWLGYSDPASVRRVKQDMVAVGLEHEFENSRIELMVDVVVGHPEFTYKRISEMFRMSVDTVRTHLKNRKIIK